MQSELQSAFDRVKARITVDSNGCWLWCGAVTDGGYGRIKVGDKAVATHRLSYTVHKGPIPRGKVIRHRCDVAGCCNPDHLEIGDHEDNVQDIRDRGRAARRVLTDDERQRILELRAGGTTKREIAQALQCNWYAVSRVLDELGIDQPRRGRPIGSRNVVRRVTDAMKTEMRAMYATGKHTQAALAERFECDQTYVSLIVRGKK